MLLSSSVSLFLPKCLSTASDVSDVKQLPLTVLDGYSRKAVCTGHALSQVK